MLRRTLLAASLLFSSASAFATQYTFDPNHTQVQFVWNHFGFSNLTGQFGKVEGTVDFDAADPGKASVNATIQMASVDSNVKKLDGELVGADYFDAAKFPTATFKSTKVTRGSTPDHLTVAGDLTLHGVTKPVTLDVTVVKVGDHPMKALRDSLPGILRAADLPQVANGAWVTIAGSVICRQRPGTAKGFVFVSLEDETGIANAVVRPALFEQFRLLITQEPALVIRGRLQSHQGVIHLKAEQVSPLARAELPAEASHDFH